MNFISVNDFSTDSEMVESAFLRSEQFNCNDKINSVIKIRLTINLSD